MWVYPTAEAFAVVEGCLLTSWGCGCVVGVAAVVVRVRGRRAADLQDQHFATVLTNKKQRFRATFCNLAKGQGLLVLTGLFATCIENSENPGAIPARECKLRGLLVQSQDAVFVTVILAFCVLGLGDGCVGGLAIES